MSKGVGRKRSQTAIAERKPLDIGVHAWKNPPWRTVSRRGTQCPHAWSFGPAPAVVLGGVPRGGPALAAAGGMRRRRGGANRPGRGWAGRREKRARSAQRAGQPPPVSLVRRNER